jgi:hypothetical protein
VPVRKRIGFALLISGVVALLGLTAGPSFASGSAGDVKVSNTSVDSIPNNDPHQSCLFNLEFYNFDLGSPDATYTLSLVSPTGGGVLKTNTVAVGGGPIDGNQLDAVANVDLTGAQGFAGVSPVSQGFHISLDVTDPGLQGGAKSKTFWVSADCAGGGTLPG